MLTMHTMRDTPSLPVFCLFHALRSVHDLDVSPSQPGAHGVAEKDLCGNYFSSFVLPIFFVSLSAVSILFHGFGLISSTTQVLMEVLEAHAKDLKGEGEDARRLRQLWQQSWARASFQVSYCRWFTCATEE